jgi:hypothetical protein
MPDRNQYGDPLQTGMNRKDMTMTREGMGYLSELISGDLRRWKS